MHFVINHQKLDVVKSFVNAETFVSPCRPVSKYSNILSYIRQAKVCAISPFGFSLRYFMLSIRNCFEKEWTTTSNQLVPTVQRKYLLKQKLCYTVSYFGTMITIQVQSLQNPIPHPLDLKKKSNFLTRLGWGEGRGAPAELIQGCIVTVKQMSLLCLFMNPFFFCSQY